MVVASGLPVRDEQLSERSGHTSKGSDFPARIEDIFEWIDGIPLSKSTKNLARDFSDAVLMSEILKFYYPHLVSPHNYIPVNSVQMKRENWQTLNRKVLGKIGMRLSNDTIEQLVHSQTGTIEKLLSDFREKQMAVSIKNYTDELQVVEETEDAEETPLKVEPPDESFIGRIGCMIKCFFATIFGFILAVLCFWKWFSKKTDDVNDKSVVDDADEEALREILESESRLRDSYGQLMQELRVKSDVIKTLCHKVAFLEGTMKLKDMKIATLSSQLEQSTNCMLAEGMAQTSRSVQNSHLGPAVSSPSKIRRRPRTQI